MLAIQIPMIASAFGIVIIDYSGHNDSQDVQTQIYQTKASAVRQIFSQFQPAEQRSRASRLTDTQTSMMAEDRSDGMWFTLILLLTLVWLADIFGRSLSRDIETDLDDIRGGIRQMRQFETSRLNQHSIGFRETAHIVEAFDASVEAFRRQQDSITEATHKRRLAESKKATFLTHISHELKSPLNSILGFSELLLAGIDGPLTKKQTQQAAAIWRRGESLLRFIIGLIELARIDGLHRRADPKLNPASAHSTTSRDFYNRLTALYRPDPTQRVQMDFQYHLEETLSLNGVFVDHSVNAILILAGTLADELKEGTVIVSILSSTDGWMECTVTAIGQPAKPDGPKSLLRLVENEDSNQTGYELTAQQDAPIRLINAINRLQGSVFEGHMGEGPWPKFSLSFPPLRPKD